jgi:hypothetical protein
VQAAAKRRLQQATDALAARLLGIALDEGTSEAVRLAAIRDALDRGGVTAKAAIEVEVGPTPAFQQIFEGIARGVGRDGKPAPTLPNRPALATADPGEIVDAEIVTDPAGSGPDSPAAPTAPVTEDDGRKRPPPWQGEPLPTDRPKRKPSTELVTMEEANRQLAAERRGRR